MRFIDRDPALEARTCCLESSTDFKRMSAGADCCLFSVWSLFVLPLPLPSPLAVDWCVSGLLCGGQRDNTHNGDPGSKRFGINRLRGMWLAKIFIALRLRIKHSGNKGYG